MIAFALLARRRTAQRHPSHFRRLLVPALFLMAMCAASRSEAQCVDGSSRVPATGVQIFQLEPAALLHEVRNDKAKLTGRVTAFIVSDVNVLPAVRTLVSEAANVERAAIGAALRRAQLTCIRSKPEAAQRISEFVQKLADSAVSSGYSAELEAVQFNPNVAPPLGTPQSRAAGSTSYDGASRLMTGEWGTDIADPFTPPPVPQ